MSVRVRPSVLSLICLPFLLLFFFLSGGLQAENNAIVGFQLLGGSGSPFWAHRMQDPYLLQRQDEALLHSLRTQNIARTLIELDHTRNQKPTVRSQTGRISFLASSGEWFAFGFSTIGSFAQVNHLPQANAPEYYDQLKRRDADFLYPAGVEYLAEVMYNQKRRSLGLSPNYMLSADMWIRPESWYVQPFLRLGISAPIEENKQTDFSQVRPGFRLPSMKIDPSDSSSKDTETPIAFSGRIIQGFKKMPSFGMPDGGPVYSCSSNSKP